MLTRRKITSVIQDTDVAEVGCGDAVWRSMRAARVPHHPGCESKRTVAVGHFSLAHEGGAAGAGGRLGADALHAGFAREGNLRAEGGHVGGDGRHGFVWVANVGGSDRVVLRCVRSSNLRTRQGRAQ